MIEGSDEGIFGWVGLNFVKERIVSSLGQQQQQQLKGEGEASYCPVAAAPSALVPCPLPF